MFGDLYNSVSLMLSWRWPRAEGVVTAVEIEAIGRGRQRLALAYEFSLEGDGPYTGESFWTPWSGSGELIDLNKRICVGQAVEIRYRRGDPSVSRVDPSVWKAFGTDDF